MARRNQFKLGVAALRRAGASGHIDKDNWEVRAMGENLSPIPLGNGVFLNPLPWMTFEDYAKARAYRRFVIVADVIAASELSAARNGRVWQAGDQSRRIGATELQPFHVNISYPCRACKGDRKEKY